jgi:DNA-binding protein HU-beta
MIKIDIANSLMKVHPCSRATALQVVDLLTERLKDALLNGHRIEIRGFGVFEPRPRKRGMGRNIKTGASVQISKGKSIRFKPGKDLREIEVA